AVVPIEFPDVKHNPKVTAQEFEDALFSKGTYTRTNATGQTVYGSLADYYREVSGGALKVEGKAFDWVEVGKKRADYVHGSGTSGRRVVLAEALDKVAARDGKESFKGYDGFLFVYAGERVQGNRGSVYYPHAGMINYGSKRTPYLFVPEGGSKMTTISGI